VWRRLQQMGVRESELEDALQEVFVAAFRNFSYFDPRRAKPTTWLFGIALDVARNSNRGQRRREAYLEYDSEPHVEAWCGTPEELLCHRQRQGLLAELLAALPLEHRTTFVLFELEGMSGDEIAEQMQVPVGTVRSRLHHARKCLEIALTKRAEAERLAGAPVP
jgi:RNA polymerase sigma-70 factor, ECF subfamily